jgi:hypothetical protein
MQLTSEQIVEKKYKIFLKSSQEAKPRLVKFPEKVDVEEGIVQMWIVPLEELPTNIVRVDIASLVKAPTPPEVDGLALLVEVEGYVIVLNEFQEIVEQTK